MGGRFWPPPPPTKWRKHECSPAQPCPLHRGLPPPPFLLLCWKQVWVGFSWCSLAWIWLLCSWWLGRLPGAVMTHHASPTNILQCLPRMPALALADPLLLSCWRWQAGGGALQHLQAPALRAVILGIHLAVKQCREPAWRVPCLCLPSFASRVTTGGALHNYSAHH